MDAAQASLSPHLPPDLILQAEPFLVDDEKSLESFISALDKPIKSLDLSLEKIKRLKPSHLTKLFSGTPQLEKLSLVFPPELGPKWFEGVRTLPRLRSCTLLCVSTQCLSSFIDLLSRIRSVEKQTALESLTLGLAKEFLSGELRHFQRLFDYATRLKTFSLDLKNLSDPNGNVRGLLTLPNLESCSFLNVPYAFLPSVIEILRPSQLNKLNISILPESGNLMRMDLQKLFTAVSTLKELELNLPSRLMVKTALGVLQFPDNSDEPLIIPSLKSLTLHVPSDCEFHEKDKETFHTIARSRKGEGPDSNFKIELILYSPTSVTEEFLKDLRSPVYQDFNELSIRVSGALGT